MSSKPRKKKGGKVCHTTPVQQTKRYIRQIQKCADPPAGEDRVIDYIAGDLVGRQCQNFVDHVAECRFCLREVIQWRTAEVLAQAEKEAASMKLDSHAPTIPMSKVRRKPKRKLEKLWVGDDLARLSMIWMTQAQSLPM